MARNSAARPADRASVQRSRIWWFVWPAKTLAGVTNRVARFAPALGFDALVFIGGRGQSRLPVATFSLAAFTIEVSLVDDRTGEVLAFVRFGLVRDVTHNT